MRKVNGRHLLRLIRLCGVAIIFLVTGYFIYLQAIVEIAGKHLPKAWSATLGEMNFDEIYKTIGEPQDDASAKQFQNWIEYHWWESKC